MSEPWGVWKIEGEEIGGTTIWFVSYEQKNRYTLYNWYRWRWWAQLVTNRLNRKGFVPK